MNLFKLQNIYSFALILENFKIERKNQPNSFNWQTSIEQKNNNFIFKFSKKSLIILHIQFHQDDHYRFHFSISHSCLWFEPYESFDYELFDLLNTSKFKSFDNELFDSYYMIFSTYLNSNLWSLILKYQVRNFLKFFLIN